MRGLTFSWKRFLGISAAKTKIARATGIPTTKNGVKTKIGNAVLKTVLGSKKKKK